MDLKSVIRKIAEIERELKKTTNKSKRIKLQKNKASIIYRAKKAGLKINGKVSKKMAQPELPTFNAQLPIPEMASKIIETVMRELAEEIKSEIKKSLKVS